MSYAMIRRGRTVPGIIPGRGGSRMGLLLREVEVAGLENRFSMNRLITRRASDIGGIAMVR